MLVTEKGQVTIPKRLRDAAGIGAGSEVVFSLEGGRIIVTPVATAVKDDRRAAMRQAAARVRNSLPAEFAPLGADEIMDFIRGKNPGEIEPGNGSR